MQLLGSTPEARRQYKAAATAEKKRLGAAFDLAAFNASWLAVDHGTPEGSRTPEAVTGEKVTAEKQPEAVTGSEVSRAQSMPAVPDPLPRVAGDDLIQGDVDDIPPEVRQIITDINGAINAYKMDHDINGAFCKEKNGATQLSACFMQICREIIKPSKVLKRKTYSRMANGGLSNNNAYDINILVIFIDICREICAREGAVFNRALYMDLTGLNYEYLSGKWERLTSAGSDLRKTLLYKEYFSNINALYDDNTGRIVAINERFATPTAEDQGARRAVGASELRKLPG